jgi:hypothetical protein
VPTVQANYRPRGFQEVEANTLGHGQHSSKFVIRVVLLLTVLVYVLFVCKCVLPPGFNPIAVDKYININISILDNH